MGAVEVVRFESDSELARTVTDDWLRNLPAVPQFCAFSGGRIAVKFFQEIAAHPLGPPASRRLEFFFADERCVPPDHADSNYRLMRENLIEPLQIPAERVHRIRGEDEPHAGAKAAAEELGDAVLDYVFLGMGEDGHVASIFPGDKAAFSDPALYRAVIAPKPPPQRITIGLNMIQQARNLWVLVSGAGKEAALAESLKPDGRTPLASVIQGRPMTRIFAHL